MIGDERRARRFLKELVVDIETASVHPILNDVVGRLPEILGAQVGCAYRVGVDARNHQYLDYFFQSGAPIDFKKRYATFVARGAPVSPAYDPRHPEPNQRNVVCLPNRAIPKELLQAMPAAKEVFQPLGLGEHEHLRVLVCDETLLCAWVGVLGTEISGAMEVALFSELVDPLRRRLVLEARLQAGDHARATFEALFEMLDVAAFVVRGDAIIEANAVGRELLDAKKLDPRIFVADARAGVKHADVRTLAIAGLPNDTLVLVAPPRDEIGARLTLAVERWKLSPAQVRVLRLLVDGNPNKLIADRLGLAVITVENHVTRLLRRSGSDSRVELVTRFWTLV